MKVTVAGAGLAGAVAARILRDLGHEVTVFETRNHIGGNCHDTWRNGILVHEYGPHGFHTDNPWVWEFVNRFTRFHPNPLRVTANTERGIIPIPFNDVSAEIAGDLSPEEIRELIFVAYSEKHWGVPWKQIPRSITSRVPQKRIGRDCRYHLDQWQGTPEEGYHSMFAAMLDGIPVHLGCGENEWRSQRHDLLVFTGSLDDYFERRIGTLEYRSLRFEYSEEPKTGHFQLNECNKTNPWTRAVDHSNWLEQDVETTVVAREFPCEWDGSNVRFYPKPFGSNPELFQRYWDAAKLETNTVFVGRLATYKYLDMDDTIAQVMTRLSEKDRFANGLLTS